MPTTISERFDAIHSAWLAGVISWQELEAQRTKVWNEMKEPMPDIPMSDSQLYDQAHLPSE